MDLRAAWRGLYAIVDLPSRAGLSPTALASALLDGGARVLQLRMKGAGAATLLAVAAELGSLCRLRGASFLVNDRLDVALCAGADGVHLGQDDLPLPDARALAPPGFLIGVSTHNRAQAEEAAAGGADYIGFGPVFSTATKENPDPVVGALELAAVCAGVAVPVVAIGGITLVRVGEVARAGAAAAAVIAAVNHASDIAGAARAVALAFAR